MTSNAEAVKQEDHADDDHEPSDSHGQPPARRHWPALQSPQRQDKCRGDGDDRNDRICVHAVSSSPS